jgi:hypothetical protein
LRRSDWRDGEKWLHSFLAASVMAARSEKVRWSIGARPGKLAVTLGMEDWRRTLTFDLLERGKK